MEERRHSTARKSAKQINSILRVLPPIVPKPQEVIKRKMKIEDVHQKSNHPEIPQKKVKIEAVDDENQNPVKVEENDENIDQNQEALPRNPSEDIQNLANVSIQKTKQTNVMVTRSKSVINDEADDMTFDIRSIEYRWNIETQNLMTYQKFLTKKRLKLNLKKESIAKFSTRFLSPDIQKIIKRCDKNNFEKFEYTMKEFLKSAIKAEIFIENKEYVGKEMRQVVYELYTDLLEPVGGLKSLKNVIIKRLPNDGLYSINMEIISAQDLAKILNSEKTPWFRDAFAAFSSRNRNSFLIFIIKIVVFAMNYLFMIVRHYKKVTGMKNGKSVMIKSIGEKKKQPTGKSQKQSKGKKKESLNGVELLKEMKKIKGDLEKLKKENRTRKGKE